MDAEQRSELAALERAHAFLRDAAPRIPRVVGSQLFADFVGLLADIRQCAAAQVDKRAGGRGSAARKRELRRTIIRDHLAPLLTVGQAYGLSHFTVSTLPGSRLRDHHFVDACRWIHTAADHHRDELERLGMGAGVCEALRAAMDDLRETMIDIGSARVGGFGARIAMRNQLRHAWMLVRAISRMIDAEPTLTANDLHDWRGAILHAPRPAHRLACAKPVPLLPAGAGSSLVVRPPAEIAPSSGGTAPRRIAPRRIARIVARVRLLLPSRKSEEQTLRNSG